MMKRRKRNSMRRAQRHNLVLLLLWIQACFATHDNIEKRGEGYAVSQTSCDIMLLESQKIMKSDVYSYNVLKATCD